MPTHNAVSKSQRRRQIIRFLALGAVLWLLWTVIRSRQLLANGQLVAQHSQSFPRDYFLGSTQNKTFTHCVLGDSTAAGWGAERLSGTYPYQVAQAIAARGYRVHVFNLAVGGATLHDVQRHQLALLPKMRPDLITLSVGANDTTHFTAPDSYKRQYLQVLKALEANTAKRVLIANTPDMVLAPALPLPLSIATNRRAQSQNHILSEALKSSKIEMVDLYGRGKLDYQQDKNLYAADLFHPSAKGYRVWASLFIEKWQRS